MVADLPQLCYVFPDRVTARVLSLRRHRDLGEYSIDLLRFRFGEWHWVP